MAKDVIESIPFVCFPGSGRFSILMAWEIPNRKVYMFKPELPECFVGGRKYEIQALGEVAEAVVTQEHMSEVVDRFNGGKMVFTVSMASRSVTIEVTYKSGAKRSWKRPSRYYGTV